MASDPRPVDPALLTAAAARAAWEAVTATAPDRQAAAIKKLARQQPAVVGVVLLLTEDEGVLAQQLGFVVAQTIDTLYSRACGGRSAGVGDDVMGAALDEFEERFASMDVAATEFAMQQLLHGFRFAAPAVVLELLACLFANGEADEAEIPAIAPILPLLIAVASAYERTAGLGGATGSLAGAAAAAGRPMGKFGRNDPCPCGSGRKFKKCCWTSTPPPPPPALRADELFGQAIAGVRRVYEFLDALPRRHPVAEEVRQHLDDVQDRYDAGEPGGLPDSQHVSEALFDFATRSGRTIGELYLERKGAKLDDEAGRTVEQLCASYPAFYVLEALQPDDQLKRLRELGTGVEWLVRDVEDPLAEVGDLGEVWLTRLVGTPDEAVSLMTPLIFPPETVAAHEEMAREAIESVASLNLPDRLALPLAMKRMGELIALYICSTTPDDEPDDDDEE